MYTLFLDKLSGRTFVNDFDSVKAALTILNDTISKDGELSANEYFKMLGLRPLYPSVKYLVFKDVMFQFYPCKIEDVDVIAIDIETYSCLFDEAREEVEFVQTVLRDDNCEVLC